jgi:uncharacterized protein YdiU (UPF0061 family)
MVAASSSSGSAASENQVVFPAREPQGASTLESLRFDNVAVRSLPVDPVEDNYIRAVKNACWSKVEPQPVTAPRLVSYSTPCLALLDVTPDQMTRTDAAEYFSGNRLFPGAMPHAHCYCGFQFGAFSGQLGDGAAMYLGEVVNSKGERWELQFKGAGKTPYSRSADGRKVLRSSIREYLCSEAMAGLGVPTTRAAALVTSDTLVQRDVMYNGNVINERASIVTRVAPTFIRFGSFEVCKGVDGTTGRSGPSAGNTELLRQLLNYVTDSFFPEATGYPEGSPERALAMFKEVVRSTAELVAAWQCVGFTHGVLNTDNLSILGLTIDYGPYGFMEHFDPDFVPNGSDGTGRYRYRDQPQMCRWNLEKLTEALEPLLPLALSQPSLTLFNSTYQTARARRLRQKLGLAEERPEDAALFESLFDTMKATSVDFTGLFRLLSDFDGTPASAEDTARNLAKACATPDALAASMRRAVVISAPRIQESSLRELYKMAREQPDQIALRFGAPPEAILEELEGEMRKLENLKAASERVKQLEGMSSEMKAESDAVTWREWLDKYGQRLASETHRSHAERKVAMDAVNPSFVLRNWVAQQAIQLAEAGDYSGVNDVLSKLENPFESDKGEESFRPPDWAAGLICTCSS